MTEITQPENPIIAPTLHEVFACLRRREETRVALGDHSTVEYTATGGAAAKAIQNLLGALQSEEMSLLRQLTDLLERVDHALRKSGASTSPLDLIRHFRSFQVAKIILMPGNRTLNHHYCFVSRVIGEQHEKGPICEVIFTVSEGNRTWRTLDVAYDLLQYWEMVLRHQTSLECADFCRAVRKYLLGRVTRTVFNDGVTHILQPPASSSSPPSRTAKAMTADIGSRLERIASHIQEHETRRMEFGQFTGHDTIPSAPTNKSLKRLECLYFDNLTFLISELVHLKDNVKKLLKAHGRSQHEMSVVENLKPYRVASCYVNTHKHGVRGGGKTAVADLVFQVSEKPGGKASMDDHLVDSIPAINYEGETWAMTTLVDDLTQMWELFLRNYTDVDTTEFRVEIGKLLVACQQQSEYIMPVPTGIDVYLKGLADDRRQLNV